MIYSMYWELYKVKNVLFDKRGVKMGDNELILIRNSQNGDIESFEILIKNYKKLAYNVALSLLKNKEDAEDVSQEALIKVFRSINSFNFKATFKVWLYRIVVNTCVDFIRKKKISTYSVDNFDNNNKILNEIVDNRNNPDVVVQNKIKKDIIYDSIKNLDYDFKIVIILRELHGLSYKEISSILLCNEGTVKSRINRARKKLKVIIESKLENY